MRTSEAPWCYECAHDRAQHKSGEGHCRAETVGDADSDYQMIPCPCEGFQVDLNYKPELNTTTAGEEL